MGRKTLDSLPRLLPGRKHLVLTHQELEPSDQIMVFHSLGSLVEYISTLDQEVTVIGGAQIYKQMLELSDKYEKGIGCKKNIEEAKKWKRKYDELKDE